MKSMLGMAALAAIVVAGEALAQTSVLRYQQPQNVFRSSVSAENYQFNGTNASVQIYQFRRFEGDIARTFQRTLLRDWISLMQREENVAGQPTFQKVAVQGADYAIFATFNEARVGLMRPHNRMLIVKGNEAAIVDASAGTVQGWQMA